MCDFHINFNINYDSLSDDVGDVNDVNDISDVSDNKYTRKFIFVEAVLAMNYGWEQIPKCRSSEECTICLDTFLDTYVLKLPCGHVFHRDCILECVVNWKFRKCAVCEKKFKFIGITKPIVENKEHIRDTPRIPTSNSVHSEDPEFDIDKLYSFL